MRIEFHPFTLDIANQRLLRGDRPIALTPRAFAVLQLLLTHAGRLLSKEEILRTVWAETHVQDAVLKVCVREIRRALDDPARDPRYIETRHRRGYRFVGRIGGAAVLHPPDGPPRRLVGREEEVAQLRGRLERALLEERQVV
ncbi:MAG TPA: transcriptional regulator, partial [Candidatus Polarisedimenticolia bacterium]|nr:transcriptional regulator [Candidatus Polarisedimenticolia bacterium]